MQGKLSKNLLSVMDSQKGALDPRCSVMSKKFAV